VNRKPYLNLNLSNSDDRKKVIEYIPRIVAILTQQGFDLEDDALVQKQKRAEDEASQREMLAKFSALAQQNESRLTAIRDRFRKRFNGFFKNEDGLGWTLKTFDKPYTREKDGIQVSTTLDRLLKKFDGNLLAMDEKNLDRELYDGFNGREFVLFDEEVGVTWTVRFEWKI